MFKKIFMILLLAVALTGCATAKVHESVNAAGDWECEASYSSGFKNFKDVEMKACSARGGAASSTGEQNLSNFVGQAMIDAMMRGQQ